MEQRTKVLLDIFEPISQDCQTWRDDLQLALTLNPDLEKVEKAMDEWGKLIAIKLLKFVNSGEIKNFYVRISEDQWELIKPISKESEREIISTEQLYNLFIKDTEEKTKT